jgi:hypothetical protein
MAPRGATEGGHHAKLARPRFSGRLVFHNLRPAELGALLWTLDFGGNQACRHSLGLGKPFGFGQVALLVDLTNSRIEPNAHSDPVPDWTECVSAFEAYMDQALGTPWRATREVQALLAMADPSQRPRFPAKLQHMVLARVPDPDNPARKKNINEFLDAKQAGLVLPDYGAQAASLSTPRSSQTGALSPRQAMMSSRWETVSLIFNRGKKEISASRDRERAFAVGAEAEPLLTSLDPAARKRLEQGRLRADITIEHRGGSNWKIVKIELKGG